MGQIKLKKGRVNKVANNHEKFDKIHEWLNKEGYDSGENGHDKEEYIIIVDTQNEMKKASDFLKSIDPENQEKILLVFSDEYGECHKCNFVYHSESVKIVNHEIMCNNCIKEDYQEEYLEKLIDNVNNANTVLSESDLNKHGFYKIKSDFESGAHAHMNDDPLKIYSEYKTENNELLFSIDAQDMFCINFSVYERKIEN